MLEDEEPYAAQCFPGMGHMQRNSFAVSNLGVFDAVSLGPGHKKESASGLSVADDREQAGNWYITGMHFSASAMKPCIVPIISFGIASVRGGECVVNALWEKGVLWEERVMAILSGVEGRLEALLDIRWKQKVR